VSDLLVHETIAISKRIKACPDAVFSAWQSPKARSEWGPPSVDEAIQFLETDFRVGGRDISLCGLRDDLRFRVEATYYAIEQPGLVVFTERVSTEDALLSVSLITVAMTNADADTQLDLTVQIASLVGAGMIDGARGGWDAALSNLKKHVH